MDEGTARLYRRWAEIEARDVSATYFNWAEGVAGDDEVVDLVAQLSGIKRQPNLVFAAARHLGAPVGPYAEFRGWLVGHWPTVVQVVESHATQTNEAARCAVLLPVLSRLEGDIALIEAGASAGLVLYPDQYSYRYEVEGSIVRLDPVSGQSTVVIPCTIDAASVPARLPDVTWRAGVDLNPIDVRDREQLTWLETLVWPEHAARRERLHAAAAIVAADPPRLIRGDLLSGIPELIAAAPSGARVVVFHSAVLNYLAAGDRQAFVDVMASFPDITWISNEGPGVLPAVTEQVGVDIGGRTIVALNGRAVGLAGAHGQSYQSL